MASVIWSEKLKRWMLRVQVDGQLKTFASRKPGMQGKKEVLKRYREWSEFGTADRSKTLVKELWEKFLLDTANRIGAKSESYKQYEKIGRLYILPAIGNKRIGNIAKSDYQNIINQAKPHNKRTKVLSEKYLKTIRMTINGLVKYAEENDYAERFKGTLYIPVDHPTIGKQILQPEDIKKLFEPSDLTYHKAICFMVCTGLRPSECLGLQWADIKKDVLYVKRGINTSGVITKGKNANAQRTIPLAGITKQLLTIQRENTKHLKSKWIFCDSVGGPGSQSTLRNHLDKLEEERGFKCCLYALRHTYISLMKNTMPEQMIKSIVGHSATMDTFGVYGHLVNGEMKQAAQLTDLAFTQIKESEQ